MRIKKVEIKNFRLLKDIQLSLEDETTVIVGRNNSGKTSLTEIFRRLLHDNHPKFFLEDFSTSTHEEFWKAFLLHKEGKDKSEIRNAIPFLQVKLSIDYNIEASELGSLSDFIIDLNTASHEAVAMIRYQLQDGSIDELFDGMTSPSDADPLLQKSSLLKLIKERIPKMFAASVFAIDPGDETNQKALEMSNLRSVFQVGFINAQRGMDDITHKEVDVLGKILEKLLTNATSETASDSDKAKAKELTETIKGIQDKIDTDFNGSLTKLLPTLKLFGYPGLNDLNLKTETILDVKRLMAGDNTKLRYTGEHGVGFPEAYNGLGSRNLIFMLFQLFEFFKSFQARQISPSIHLVFIEEPEAHLHPQMQEVFIRQIGEISKTFSKELNEERGWPVQFVVTTHSSHIANEAPFENIRYFLNTKKESQQTIIKDLRIGFKKPELSEAKDFLHKFLTLTRCDLFFADKAILIEGPTERLLLPKMLEKFDLESTDHKLESQYISTVEVGGAYAHHFFDLLDFLELRTLIITDIDSVKAVTKEGKTSYPACKVIEGTHTCNTGLKKWFNNDDIAPSDLILKTPDEKVAKGRRIAYQVPEIGSTACGRSFEDAFMLANQVFFSIVGTNDEERANSAWDQAKAKKKTDFAIEHALYKTDWKAPRYILDGLSWLAEPPQAPPPQIGEPTPADMEPQDA